VTGVPITRRFMGSRKMRDLPAITHHTARVIADWEQLRVRTSMGNEFKRESRVVLRRPRWMPVRLYSRLLRSIVVETREPTR
jgi:hypothetical protein